MPRLPSRVARHWLGVRGVGGFAKANDGGLGCLFYDLGRVEVG